MLGTLHAFVFFSVEPSQAEEIIYSGSYTYVFALSGYLTSLFKCDKNAWVGILHAKE